MADFPIDKFRCVDFIGSGGFGHVHHYSSADHDPKDVAVKKLPISGKQFDKSRREWNEVNLLAALQHPNIVLFFGISKLDGQIGIVMELCKGNLESLITSKKRLDVDEVGFLMQQICSGVCYLHSKGIIHRDLKPQNILVQCFNSYDHNDYNVKSLDVKIADFGLAKDLDGQSSATMSVGGTELYMAPELKEVRGRMAHCSKKSDIYSLGLVAYNLYKKDLKYLHSGNHEFPDILQNRYLPRPLYYFLFKCLRKVPAERNSAEELIRHQLLNADSALDTSTEESNPDIPGIEGIIRRIHCATSDMIILGTSEGHIVIMDKGHVTKQITTGWHRREIVSITSNENFFAVGSLDLKVSIWSKHNLENVKIFDAFKGRYVWFVEMTNDYLVVVEDDRRLLVFSTLDWHQITAEKEDKFSDLRWAILSQEILTLTDSRTIKQFKIGKNRYQKKQEFTIKDHTLTFITPADRCESEEEYWVGTTDGIALKVNLKDKRILVSVTVSKGSVFHQISCYGQFLFCRLCDIRSFTVVAIELEDLHSAENERGRGASPIVLDNVPFRQLAEFGNITSNVEPTLDGSVAFCNGKKFIVMTDSEIRQVSIRTELL